MFAVVGPTIDFERCSRSPEYPHGHCYHGVFFGGPITSKGRCCWCGEDKDLPWGMSPERSHGEHHPVRAADRGASAARWEYASFENPPHEHEWTDHAYCVMCGIRYDSLPAPTGINHE